MVIASKKDQLIVHSYKGKSLKEKLYSLVEMLKEDEPLDSLNLEELMNSALILKRSSAQINEVVHSAGILLAWDKIREDGEYVIEANLAASGRSKINYDLETNLRVAEFKFSDWQENSSNGLRGRGVLKDLVGLMQDKTDRRREIYVSSVDSVLKYLASDKAWKSQLDKSGSAVKECLSTMLNDGGMKDVKTVSQLYQISRVTIHDIKKVISIK